MNSLVFFQALALTLLTGSSLLHAASTMADVVGVLDAHSLVVRDTVGERIITLAGVEPVADDWGVGAVALRQLLAGRSVFLDNERTSAQSNPSFYVYRSPDGLDVNLTMISDGYAVAARGPSERRDKFELAEAAARDSRRGIWSDHGLAWEWETRHLHTRYLGELPSFTAAAGS